jgi:AraC-like DNA-binding protein
MDPLSDVLSLLDARNVLAACLTAGGRWCVSSPRYQGIRFGAVMQGSCFLEVEGMTQPISLQAGECYLLTDGHPYRIGSDLTANALDISEVFARVANGSAHLGTQENFTLLAGRFDLDPIHTGLLLDSLPPVIHIASPSEQADTLRWVLERLAIERLSEKPGASSMVEHLAHILLVETLRAYLAREAPASGWLAGITDPKIGASLRLIHHAPAQKWTLGALATSAGMSRSAFALRFKTLVGTSPIDYLLDWRMRQAGKALMTTKEAVFQIGLRAGYESESAFSNAFKRVMGHSPRAYRRLDFK